MQTEYLLSGHAQQRLKERLKVKNIRRAHREVEIAYTKGKLINRMQGENKAYFLFNNSVYVFNETFCNVCKLCGNSKCSLRVVAKILLCCNCHTAFAYA